MATKNNKQVKEKEAKVSALFPTWARVDKREAGMVSLPAAASAYFSPSSLNPAWTPCTLQGGTVSATNCPENKTACRAFELLPYDRTARYGVLRTMALDPTIDSAIKMHIANAFAPDTTGKVLSIVPADSDTDTNKFVDDLKASIMPFVDKDLSEWARKTAVYGTCFVRVYGKNGVGIENIRCDYYTQPQYVQKFEKGGRLAGYTSTYQGTIHYAKQIKLLPPWYFVDFQIPDWLDSELKEPISVTGRTVDLSTEESDMEGLIESQEYGTSLLATAYSPWRDMLDAICSMKMSRRNAARLERLVGINTGRLDPERAARYLDMIAERITNGSSEIEKQSWLNGNVQTVVNHIVPIFGDKGGMQVDEVKGTPDINGLEDVMFHVKRLGSGLGIDPALLGFGDLLSGGLGDGGFFRVSLIAGTKAQLLRTAIQKGIERLCDIHIAYKYGKVFLPTDKPYKVVINAANTALDKEAQDTLSARAQTALNMVSAFGAFDQEFACCDKHELAKLVWEQLNLPEERFEKVFSQAKAEKAEDMDDQMREAELQQAQREAQPNNTDNDPNGGNIEDKNAAKNKAQPKAKQAQDEDEDEDNG